MHQKKTAPNLKWPLLFALQEVNKLMGTLPPAIQALTGVDLTGVRIDSFLCFLFNVKIEANIYMRLAD